MDEVTFDAAVVPAMITWAGSQGRPCGFQNGRVFGRQNIVSYTIEIGNLSLFCSHHPMTYELWEFLALFFP